MNEALRFERFKRDTSLAFMLILVVFWYLNRYVLEDSISAFVDVTPVAFGSLLSLAAFLFIMDGATSIQRRYTILTGISLFGVVMFHYKEYEIVHYSFAIMFFGSSILSMVFTSPKKERVFWLIIAIIVTAIMGILIVYTTILWAEYFGMMQVVGWYRHGIKHGVIFPYVYGFYDKLTRIKLTNKN